MTKATVSGQPPEPGQENATAPTSAKLADGQHADHWILSEEERRAGYVRPVRRSYKHVGTPGPRFPLRDLTPEEVTRYGVREYTKFEEYPETERPATGRFWTAADLARVGQGCGGVTTMPVAIAETYAARPGFYGKTFCATCRDYYRVGADGEFVWNETTERVGT